MRNSYTLFTSLIGLLFFFTACSSIPVSPPAAPLNWKSPVARAQITYFKISGKLLLRSPSETFPPLRFLWQESPAYTSILLENTFGITLANIQRRSSTDVALKPSSHSFSVKNDGRYWLTHSSKSVQAFDSLEDILSQLFGKAFTFPAGILLDVLLARRQAQWDNWKILHPDMAIDWQIRSHHKMPISSDDELPQYINITYTPPSSKGNAVRLFIESWHEAR